MSMLPEGGIESLVFECALCPAQVAGTAGMIAHLRQRHSDVVGDDVDFERWPDGEIVVGVDADTDYTVEDIT